jgi:DegV family protein with EDD domain
MSSVTAGEQSWQAQPVARSAAIVCESTSCLPDDLVRQYDIGIIPIPFVFGTETFRDGVDITRAEFYQRLRESRMPPKTSPPSPGEYLEAWKAAAQRAPAVVCVTVDSKVSTLQRSARLASEMASQALPGIPVAVIDSLSAGMGQGFVALAAARSAAEGKPLEEIVAVAERVSRAVRVIVALDTLEYLARTSHIPQIAAFLGGVLAIKPIFRISGGDIHVLSRPRTRHHSLNQLVEQLRSAVPADAHLHIAVQHAEAQREAEDLLKVIQQEFTCVESYITEFTPVMGGYCGPGLVGVAYYADEDLNAS